jgi:hypothetical protein
MNSSKIVREIRYLTKSINNQNKLIRQCFIKMSENQKTRELRIVLKILFTDPPPVIDLDNINRLTDKSVLQKLESKYDEFINKNQDALFSHELIDDVLVIRDNILLRLGRVVRSEKIYAGSL